MKASLPKSARAVLLAAASPFLASTVAHAAPLLVDFNNPGDLAASFSDNGPGSAAVRAVDSGGIGSSGMLDVRQSDGSSTSLVYNGGSYDGTASGATVVQSIYFQWVENNAGSNQPLVLGLTGDLVNQFGKEAGATPAWVGGAISDKAASSVNTIQLNIKTWDGSAGTASYSSAITMTPGQWYYFSVSVTLGSTWSETLSLYEADPATGARGTLMGTFSSDSISTPLSSDSSIYGGIRIINSTGTGGLGIDAIDNYSLTPAPIPEPSSPKLAFLGAASLLFFGISRRKLRRKTG